MHDLARPRLAHLRAHRHTRRLLTAGALVVITLLGTACLPSTPQEQDLWIRTVQARQQNGVETVLWNDDALTARAQEWARSLATRRVLAHSDLRTLDTGWTSIAENVGRGTDPQVVFDQLLASPAHRANLLDPRWNQAGVGMATAKDGTVYVVQEFQQK